MLCRQPCESLHASSNIHALPSIVSFQHLSLANDFLACKVKGDNSATRTLIEEVSLCRFRGLETLQASIQAPLPQMYNKQSPMRHAMSRLSSDAVYLQVDSQPIRDYQYRGSSTPRGTSQSVITLQHMPPGHLIMSGNLQVNSKRCMSPSLKMQIAEIHAIV